METLTQLPTPRQLAQAVAAASSFQNPFEDSNPFDSLAASYDLRNAAQSYRLMLNSRQNLLNTNSSQAWNQKPVASFASPSWNQSRFR